MARGTEHTAADPALFAALWPKGIVGTPDDYEDLPAEAYDTDLPSGPPSLFRHLQQRREFLRTGRGGLSGSLVVAFGFLALHVGLLAGGVTAFRWGHSFSVGLPLFGRVTALACGCCAYRA